MKIHLSEDRQNGKKLTRNSMILSYTVNSHPKLETCDIFHMAHLKDNTKGILKKIIQ